MSTKPLRLWTETHRSPDAGGWYVTLVNASGADEATTEIHQTMGGAMKEALEMMSRRGALFQKELSR